MLNNYFESKPIASSAFKKITDRKEWKEKKTSSVTIPAMSEPVDESIWNFNKLSIPRYQVSVYANSYFE